MSRFELVQHAIQRQRPNSSAAAADANSSTAVGIISNDDGSGGALYNNWPAGADSGSAVTVTNTDVLIKYTYFGDADLNGIVDNSSDYLLWLNGFNSGGSLAGWFNGDFDYNGTVDNSSDYLLWLNVLSNQGSPLSGAVLPVPEPGALLLAAWGLMGIGWHLIRRPEKPWQSESIHQNNCGIPTRY